MENLAKLRDAIEAMEKIHQIFILDILLKGDAPCTENANGTFVNLTLLPPEIIDELQDYTTYVLMQEKQLGKAEALKKQYQEKFYDKDTREKSAV